MAYDRFMIAPINSGLETDLKPFLIPDDSFAQLNNAYVFRGRLRKRFGSVYTGVGATPGFEQLFSRLRIPLTGGNGKGKILTGTATSTIALAGGGGIVKIGQIFSVSYLVGGVPHDIIYTIVDLTIGATDLLCTDPAASGTYDSGTNTYVINAPLAPDGTQIYFYPSEPVMGLWQYEIGPINNQPSYAFDTQFVYKFSGAYWNKIGPATQFNGSDSQFFWATTWTGISHDLSALFVTNFNAVATGAPGLTDDPIWTWDNTTWKTFKPKFLLAGIGNYVQTARIILPFKDRLVLLNTIEVNEAGTTNASYVNRCRFSRNGTPFNTDPVKIGTIAVGGGFGPFVVPGGVYHVGQQFSISTVIFTVTNPAPGPQTMNRFPAGGGAHTFDLTTGTVIFAGETPGTDIYFYADQSAWLEPNEYGAQGAGYIDAPTEERIISAFPFKT